MPSSQPRSLSSGTLATFSKLLLLRTGDVENSAVVRACDARKTGPHTAELSPLKVSMTTYATRSPLQLLINPHMMSDSWRTTRRTSARLADKEDVPVANGTSHTTGKGKGGQANAVSTKQDKAVGNGVAGGAVGGRAKRKIADDDEEVDGFMFTRTRSKRAKGTPIGKPQQPPLDEIQEEAPKPVTKKPRKKAASPGSYKSAPVEKEVKEVKRRRSPRNSGDGVPTEPPPSEVKKRKTKEKGSSAPGRRKSTEPPRTDVEGEPNESIDVVGSNSQEQQVETSGDVTKIALPFADTPIIRRNQEMRKGAGGGHRRSSLGMRGRRASSLIDGGKSNEPRRMRQLLTWCGTRALGEKPSFEADDSHAKLAAREIQQQLLKDFSAKSIMSDWFSREDIDPPPQPPQPNPKNIANLAKIQELEQQIAR
ncbi:MAG: hypothetical protein Q9187_005615, partial [Circinaria calcarea]